MRSTSAFSFQYSKQIAVLYLYSSLMMVWRLKQRVSGYFSLFIAL
ncbi:hypothetical protein JCM19235_2561 [Vibrio maritimus]|uniref:Uncharacterized protein n=1 Tax=Vibrio maritimus TaxID=990268 RepID=A0A090RX47_9VIBR|nr:hypothetical protein JCM19235_2561 [Vibrio maritimus]